MVGAPETHYARDGDLHVAYQVASDAGPDLLFIPTATSPSTCCGTNRPPRTRCAGWHRSAASSCEAEPEEGDAGTEPREEGAIVRELGVVHQVPVSASVVVVITSD